MAGRSSFNFRAIIQPKYKLTSITNDTRTDRQKANAKVQAKAIKVLMENWVKKRIANKIKMSFDTAANEAERGKRQSNASKFWGFSTAQWNSKVNQNHKIDTHRGDTIIIDMRLQNKQQPYNYALTVHTKTKGSRVYHGTIGNMAAYRLSPMSITLYPKYQHHREALPGASESEKRWVTDHYDMKVPKAVIIPIGEHSYIVRPDSVKYASDSKMYISHIKTLAKNAVIDSIGVKLKSAVTLV